MPSPISWSSTASVDSSYIQEIDALLGGVKWASSTVTYSFPGYDSSWSSSTSTGYGPSSGDGEPWSDYFDTLSSSDQFYFVNALQEWASVAGLAFIRVVDTSYKVGDIRAAYTLISSDVQAHAYYPSNSSFAGDVWMNSVGTSATLYWTPGSYENFVVLHELGHAMGLKHPFYEADSISTILPSSLDTQSYTIMSYSAQPGDSSTYFSYYPTTPMILDIQAIQYMYGANNSFQAGDSTYLYADDATYHEAIWDAGGVDTIQYAGYWDSAIDLRAGYGSDIGANVYIQDAYGANLRSVNNVWISYGVTIENAVGGNGNDILTGNEANNSLDGGAGIDAASYPVDRAMFNVAQSVEGWLVSGDAGVYATDTLINIERIHFSDVSIALDVDGGNAGVTAKILGAVFGAASISNAAYVGIGLSCLDGGMSYEDLMLLALNAQLGAGFSDIDEVNLLYQNIAGTLPSAADLAYWTETLASGQLTQASLAVMAADLDLNAVNISLAGLAESGIEYI